MNTRTLAALSWSISLAMLGSCSSSPRASNNEQAAAREGSTAPADWYVVVSNLPGPEVTDATMRARIEASGHPWKVRDRSTGIEMVLVMPGEFLMGSPASEAGRKPDEGPQHRVRLTQAYYMGATGVTQAQWRRLMGPTSSFFEGEDRPIDPSWDDAQAFLREANATAPAGRAPLRLPTEAEWEHACRAGTGGPFSFEGPMTHALVNFNDGEVESALVVDGKLEVQWTEQPSPECRMSTVRAGSLPPNAWGLHEMHGNLWEWCSDEYSPDAYAGRTTPAVDPFEEGTGAELRVLRGGSWYDNARYCRSAARDAGGSQVRSNRIGLRVARSL